MKKLFLFSAIAAMVTTGVVAQESKEKAAPAQKPTTEQKKQPDMSAIRAEWEKKIKDELKLTPEQVPKFDALNKEYNDKIDAVAQDASIDKETQKAKKMSLKKEKETKLFEILTPEQQVTYKELIEKKKKEMESKPGS